MTRNRRISTVVTLALFLFVCGCDVQKSSAEGAPSTETKAGKPIGSIERLDPRLDELIPRDARLEKLAEGFDWAEGPVWVSKGKYLLFSDVPQNTIFKWKEGEGITVYMKPSGTSTDEQRGGEPGSNGLVLDLEGRLVLAEHGDRRISREDAPGKKTTLADRYNGKRFNSPNDLSFKSNGDLYFTDPPYGLVKGMEDPEKELDLQGVYRLGKDGQVTLLTKELSRPNGIVRSHRTRKRFTWPIPTRRRRFGWLMT